MSEIVTIALAAVAVGACATVGKAGYEAYRGLTWVSETAVREMERLEQVLSEPLTHVTPREAMAEFDRQFAVLRAQAVVNPVLQGHADAAARIIVLKRSPLNAFLTRDQLRCAAAPGAPTRTVTDLLTAASARFAKAGGDYIARSVVEVAAQSGFTNPTLDRVKERKRTLVLADSRGRAVVAKVNSGEEGTRVHIDLTGMGDRSCHPVMDEILRGLAERGIDLRRVRRQSHYRRDGALQTNLKDMRDTATPVLPVSEKRTGDRQRRRPAPNNTRTLRK